MDRDQAALERDPRAALGHVERVGHADDAGLEGERLPAAPVARDRLEHLGDDHGERRLLVDAVQELARLRLGEEEAPVLVAVAVHGHADAVEKRGEDDHDLGVLLLHPVVGDERRPDVALDELAQELERDVGHDLDVDPGVVVDPEALDGVHVRDVPPGFQRRVLVRAPEEPPEPRVAARGHVQPHLRDRVLGAEPGLALRLVRDGVLDPLADLGLEIGHVRKGSPAARPRLTPGGRLTAPLPERTMRARARTGVTAYSSSAGPIPSHGAMPQGLTPNRAQGAHGQPNRGRRTLVSA